MIQSHVPYVEHRQSADRDATAYEMELAGALEAAFAKGAHELPALVAALNEGWVRPPSGGDWTAETFTALMHELGT
jgi:hypothetical protein